MDNLTKEKRSKIMSSIRSKNNLTTELRMASLLRKSSIKGWRRHLPLPGRPDFTWPKARLVLFIDGCFWHGCKKCYKPPKSNKAFWTDKIEKNQKRDRKKSRELKAKGWMVLRIRECDLANDRHAKNWIKKIKTIVGFS